MPQSPLPWPEFEGRAYVVSGGSRGLGAAIAEALARNGARVAVVGRDAAAVERAAQSIAERGGVAIAIAADVGDPADCRRVVETASAAFGGLDGLVNNAAHFEVASLREVGPKLAARMLDTNFNGPLFLGQAFANAAITRKAAGTIVNVSSIAGRRPSPGLALYCASKAALDMLTQAMALEWTPLGVRVCGVAPGHIATPGVIADFAAGRLDRETMEAAIPARRIASTEDIAEAALYLLSPRARHVTGATLTVDGGEGM